MAYIVQIAGHYTREQFVAALAGKQPKLYNQVNIKSVNDESLLGAGNIVIEGGSSADYTYDLSALEQTLHDAAITKIDAIKAINPNNDMMVFGFLSDLHTMPTYEEIQASDASDAIKAAWPSSDTSYYGATAEDNLRLLGSICYDINADAVFCGGDLSSGRLTYDCYEYMLERMKDLFDQYISVPHFLVEGNHDRRYSSSVACRSNADWLTFLQSFNSSGATYIDGRTGSYPNAKVGNTYYVDFASHKVRVIMRSQYEKQEENGSYSAYGLGCYYSNLYKAMQFDTPSDAADWTIMTVAHYWLANVSKYFTAYLNGSAVATGAATDNYNFGNFNNGTQGKAVVGELFGHLHADDDVIDSDGNLTSIRVHQSFHAASADMTSRKSYTLSMYVLDTTACKLYEVKVGKGWSTTAGVETTPDTTAYDSTNDWYVYDLKHN